MSVIYVLLAISIAVALIFFAAFILAVKKGQYDDAYTPSVRMLFEDELRNEPSKKETKQLSLPAGKAGSRDTEQTDESRQQIDCNTLACLERQSQGSQ